MAEYGFTLILTGEIESRLDELYEAGCDDASFGSVDGVWHADFDREAISLEGAVASAVADVESVGGVRVKGIQRDPADSDAP